MYVWVHNRNKCQQEVKKVSKTQLKIHIIDISITVIKRSTLSSSGLFPIQYQFGSQSSVVEEAVVVLAVVLAVVSELLGEL